MKDNRKIIAAILIIALIIIDAFTFTLINDFTGTRIVNAIFLNIAIIVLWFFIFINTKEKNSKFLNYTKLPIVLTYSIITIVLSIILMIANPESLKISILLHILITGIFAIIMLTNQAADNHTEAQVEEMKNKTDAVKEFSNKLKNILLQINDRDLYKKVEKVYDTARSAKINVKEDVSEIDNEISSCIDLLEINVTKNDTEEIEHLISKINTYFVKRNNA
ncbi:MAG: hypothetical protein IJV31_03865 [Clostridia bacterium]|nr:hypothetical protein [Clostridia bacterium]